MNDEEVFKWVVMERLFIVWCLCIVMIYKGFGRIDQVDVVKIGFFECQFLIDNLFKVIEEDNEKFLFKFCKWINK